MAGVSFLVLRRRPWLVLTLLLSFIILLSLALFAPHSVKDAQGLLLRVGSKKGAKEPEEQPEKQHEKQPELYHWKTRSPFEPVQYDDWQNASTGDLCASFPSYLLNEVQPVLKTGHGVLESRVRPQLDASLACLDNLLTFSEVTEQFENQHFIDVLEDIPQELIESDDQLEPYRRLQECVSRGSTDCGDAIDGKEAWKMDKFKFLTMATRAWKMRPERRWYVFFEADTILFWDNVFRLVSNFDADVGLYFGSPSPGRDGTWFAYGGSGFILSREAMRRLVSDDWDARTGEYLGSRLTETHWDALLHDCCGDSVIGWALHEKNVSLGGLWPMFNPHPPHGVPFSDLYWCQPMLGMHKPHQDDLQSIFRWEYGHRQYDRPLLYRDLAVSYYNFTGFERKEDWDNAGWDAFKAPPLGDHYSENPGESPDTCASACEAHPDCMQWTHHGDVCTFVRSIRLGKPKVVALKEEAEKEADTGATSEGRSVAGWATERIEKWIEQHPCDVVQWVTPSVKRIF